MNKKGSAGIIVLCIFLFLVFIFAVGFIGQAMSLWNLKFWEPKFENAKRDIWEQTSSRINGATQEIATRQLEYSRTNSSIEKRAICASLRNQFPDITLDEIDDDRLSRFFSTCKYGN